MKKLMLAALVAASGVVHADVVIDDFTTGQALTVAPAGPTEVDTPGSYGGFGLRSTLAELGTNPYNNSFSIQIAGDGTLSSNAGSGVQGETTLYYSNPSGGVADLSGTNALDIKFISNDMPLNLEWVIGDHFSPTNYLEGTTTIAQGFAGDLVIPYSSASFTGGSLNLSQVGVLELYFNNQAGGDFTLGKISATAVPEPISLATLAIGAVGILRRRRKA